MDKQNTVQDCGFEIVSYGLDRIPDVARFLGISRSQVYAFMAHGDLPYVKLNKSRRVPRKAMLEFARKNLIVKES